MNMQKIMLEALSASDNEKISRDSGRTLAKLISYVFPVDANTVRSQKIKDKLNKGEPVTFQWAAMNYANDSEFLYDLGKSIAPQMNGTSLFFEHQGERKQWPLLSKMEAGPELFESFAEMMARNLAARATNHWKSTFDANGVTDTKPMDGVNGIIAATEPYYRNLEKKLKEGKDLIERNKSIYTEVSTDDKLEKAVLCGAYLRYMFQVVKAAEKPIDDATGKKESKVSLDKGAFADANALNDEYDELRDLVQKLDIKMGKDVEDAKYKPEDITETVDELRDQIAEKKAKISDLEKYAGHASHVISHRAIKEIPKDDTGALDNWGSVLNSGEDNRLRVVDPTRVTDGTLSELRMYPKYVIDVLRLRLDKGGSKPLSKLVSILKNNGYDKIADVFDKIASSQDNRILPITRQELVTLLTDSKFVTECMSQKLGDIFKKGGQSWVVGTDASSLKASLANLLSAEPQLNNADLRNPRAVPVVEGQSLKHSITSRERTDDGVVAQTYKDMILGTAVATKIDDTQTRIIFTTKDNDGTHRIDLQSGWESKTKTMFKNVIARKVTEAGGGHEYYISIPFGLAFVAMQDEEGTIVRTENIDTLSMGLKCQGKEQEFSSLQTLMNSPIGKYCNAVANLGKVGRVRFSTDEANKAYAKILGALTRYKMGGQKFSGTPSSMKDNLAQLEAPLSYALNAAAKKPMSESEITAAIQAIKAPLLAKGLSMNVEVYKPEIGKFEFTNAPSMPSTMMSHLNDMYNLDATDGYSPQAVVRVLSAVAPFVWDLSEWNYANVLRADKASKASDEEPASVVDNAGNLENGDDVEYKEVGDAFDDNMRTQTADDGSTEEAPNEAFDVAAPDIGRADENALESAIHDAYQELFSNYNAEPNTQKDAVNFKSALLEKIRDLIKNNELNLPGIEQAIATIDCSSFKDFWKELFKRVRDLAYHQSNDADDGSLKMGQFAETGMSNSWLASIVKNVLVRRLPEDTSPEDMKWISEIGQLMAKFSFAKSSETGLMGSKFDRDNLISTFEESFAREFKALQEYIADLKRRIDETSKSLDNSYSESLDIEYKEAIKQAQFYHEVQEKLESDPQLLARVADLITRNSDDIKKVLRGDTDEATNSIKPFVDFRADTARSNDGAGNAIIDFCMYNMEASKEKENIIKLTKAFGTPVIASMMNDLSKSVPSECIAMDSIRDEKSIDLLDDNQRSLLMSYYKKADRYDAGLTNEIKQLYQNQSIEDYFAVDTARGETSPYTYNDGTNEVQISMPRAKAFFDKLMNLADTYNYIGTSESNPDGITHIQETVNNEELDKHVLHNQYFELLKTDFNNVYNRYVSQQPFTNADKRVMDRVVREVLSNPMNVLINNNVKLITAYVYHKAIIEKTQGGQYQSMQASGFGSGETIDTSVRGNNLKPALRGIKRNYDIKTDALRLSYTITHSEDFVKTILPKATKAAGGLDQARMDYVNYLEYASSDDDEVNGSHARDYMRRILNTVPSGIDNLNAADKAKAINRAQAMARDNILKDNPVFCTYGIDDKTKPAVAERITNTRSAELVVLLYDTAYKIWERMPQPSPDHIAGIMNAHRDLLNSKLLDDVNAMIPQELFERFRNLDAELELAAPEIREKIYGFKKSNNDTSKTAANVMQERASYAPNLTADIVDTLIADGPVNESALGELFTTSGMTGEEGANGSGITLTCQCDVVDKNTSGTQISSNKLLYAGDILVFKEPGIRRPSAVINVIDAKNKQYVISNVVGVEKNDTDIEFVRFQKKNKFSGGDVQAKLNNVVETLREWCDEYTSTSVPDTILFKAFCLKYIYAGSGCAKVIKTLVSYYVWKLTGYTYDLKPKTDVSGDNPNGDFITSLMTIVAEDLRKFKDTDLTVHDKILDFAVESGLLDSARANANLSSNADVRRSATEKASLIGNTALFSNAKNAFKTLINQAGKRYGFVDKQTIDTIIKGVMDTDEGAKRLGGLAQGSYDKVVEGLIKDNNWTLAKPLVEDYKRDCASSQNVPTVDGAIQYVKDNYVGPTIDNSEEFADYLKQFCANDIEWLIKH